MSREVMKAALEALEANDDTSDICLDAIVTLREALAQLEPWTPEDMAYRPGGLAQPEQEPIMTKDEALNQALDALKHVEDVYCITYEEAMIAIEEALAQPEHPAQMARLGWQYVECPACGSEGARAFPKPEEKLVLAQEVIGCFHAAEVEGLTAALANTTDEHLKDLVERRLMHALYAAQETQEEQNECN